MQIFIYSIKSRARYPMKNDSLHRGIVQAFPVRLARHIAWRYYNK